MVLTKRSAASGNENGTEPKIVQLYILRMLALYILATVMLIYACAYVVVTSGLKGMLTKKKLTAIGRWRPCDKKLNLYIGISFEMLRQLNRKSCFILTARARMV